MDKLLTLNKQTLVDLIGNEPEELYQFRLRFLQQAKESLKKLVQLYNADSYNEIKEEAHFLKTSAKAIGAEKTAQFLQQLEHEALNGHKINCKLLIKNINSEIKLVYQESKQ